MTTAPLLFLAMLAQQGGAAVSPDPARAVMELQRAIRSNPEVESNYTQLGNVLLSTQNFNEAAMVLEAARSKFPWSAQAALSVGVAYYGLRRFEAAVGALLDAGRLEPDIEQPIAFLHRMSENWGARRDDVLTLFTAYARNHPESALAFLAVGKATGDAEALKKAIRLNPRNPEGHMELGAVLESKRDFAAAIAAFRKAALLAPKNPVPHFRLSRLYARTGDSARSEAEGALHEKLSAQEKVELDRRQAATKHLDLKVRP